VEAVVLWWCQHWQQQQQQQLHREGQPPPGSTHQQVEGLLLARLSQQAVDLQLCQQQELHQGQKRRLAASAYMQAALQAPGMMGTMLI
jgi:hypothetical protein